MNRGRQTVHEMRRRFMEALVLGLGLAFGSAATPAEPGQSLFQEHCASCHTIGDGPLVGPDLAGIHDRRSREWLESFVQSPQSMIESGDPEAVAVFEEFDQMPMPDSGLSGQQIGNVLDHIRSASGDSDEAGDEGQTAESDPAAEATPAPEDVALGRELFQGSIRFEQGGPACNACHDVNSETVTGGGALAVELTSSFSRMGGAGLRSILEQAPFPLMTIAYQNRPLSEREISALVAFLRDADSRQGGQGSRDHGVTLLISGTAGTVFLFALYTLLWSRRRRTTVNQQIFDRQIRSR